MVDSLLWDMQDLDHQFRTRTPRPENGQPRIHISAGRLEPITHRPLSSSFYYGVYLESYKVIPKRNYLGAYG